MNGHDETASARCRLASSPRPFDHVCGENIRPQRSARPAILRQPPSPAGQDDVRLHDVDPAAQHEVARLVQAAHHLARREPQRRAGAQPRVALDVVRRERLLEPVDAERLERAGALIAVATSQRGLRSPAMRQPWLASTISSSSDPTASRTASTTATSSRQSEWWKRSLTARTPASRRAVTRRARSSGATSSPLEA